MRLVTLPGVFRPRSDTWMLARALSVRAASAPRVLDVFTGSGALAVVAARAGAGRVTAVDVSRRAVLCARLNGLLNGVHVRAVRGDLFAAVGAERFDLIVANPPYLPSEHGDVPRGPRRAWEGGTDGRLFLDRLCAGARAHLRPGGSLLLVQSSVAGVERTVAALGSTGLKAEVIDRRRGPLGPLLAERTPTLEARGLLQPGEREEELVVVSARLEL